MPSLMIDKVNRKPTPNPAGIEATLAMAAARFEAASIKPANPDERPMVGILYTGGSQMKAGGTLRELIALALRIPPNVAADMVVGLPKSADGQKWDISAKMQTSGEGAPGMIKGRLMPPPISVAVEMLRGLLVDSFELKTHSENRGITVYALTLGSGKPKLIQANDSERAGCKPDPNAPRPATNIAAMIACKNTSMAELAYNLQLMGSAYIEHPIVDATGLEGGWDFVMGWTPRNMMQPAPPNPNAPATATVEASEPNGTTAFEAVEKELGLKLVKQKRSIPVIVVDRADEKPVQ